MKTKHILTALALPAMFAACTADDIVSVENGMQQAERPMLSEDFVLKVENGNESRYAVEGSTSLEFNFEEGDLIGANVIDAYTAREGETFDKEDPTTWDIVPYIAPALPFENNGGEWKSAGRVGMGNYLFTNPYNPEDEGRGAAKYELPVVVQYDSENPNAHIEKYNKAVAATVLYKADLNANINLKNLFTYPKIRINFDKDLEVKKVTKIVLQKKNAGKAFIYKGALDNKNIEDMFNPANIEAKIKESKTDAIVDEASYWATKTTSDFIIDTNSEKTWAGNSAELKTTPYFVYEMNETVKSNSIDVRFMLPSIKDFMNPTVDEEITMIVCTDAGNYEMELTDVTNYKFKDTTLAAVKKNAFARNMSNTLTTLPIDTEYTGELVTDNLVSTVEDWNALVEKYGHLKKYSAEYKKDHLGKGDNDADVLVVTIFDDEFALTSDLKMPEVAEFIINSGVGVEGDVTLKNIKMENATLTVKKGATLTTDPTLVAPVVEVEEGGSLVFAAEYNKDEELVAYTKVTTVNNQGTVTIPAGVIAQFELNNAKEGVVNVGTESRAAEEAIANLSGINNGIINNYSVLNVVAKNSGITSLTNNVPTTQAEYEWDAEEEEWDGVPTINNFGTFNAKGKTVNYGLFNNNGVLSSNFVGEAYFYNQELAGQEHPYTATLAIAKKAETYFDGNTGVIELAELKPEKFTIHNAKEAADYKKSGVWGTIKYTLNDKASNTVTLAGSPVTHLTTNVGINLTNTYSYVGTDNKTQVCKLTELVVNGGEVKIAKTTKAADNSDVYAARVEKMVINSGEVVIADEINSVDNVTIKAGAEMGIPTGAKFAVAALANITTEPANTEKELKAGLLEVNGTLFLTGSSNKTGIYGTYVAGKNIVLHKGVQIACNKVDNSAAENAAALQAKYDNAVTTWWSDITNNMSWIPTYYNYNPYDTEVIAEVLKVWFEDETCNQHSLAEALFIVWGFADEAGDAEATYTALDAEEKVEAIAAKLTDNSNFTSAIASKVLTLADTATDKALTNLKALFIGENSKKEAILKNITISRNEVKIYESKEEALTENVYKVLAAYGEKNKENVAKYVNIYQFKTDLATAFGNSTFTNAAGTFDAEYAYVWEDCDLDKVVAVMAKYTYEDWKNLGLTTQTNIDNFYTLAGVQEFLRLANVKGGTTGAAGVAYTISETYYEASSEWQYSNDQVKLLAGTLYGANVSIKK